jgi:hypothetical protein
LLVLSAVFCQQADTSSPRLKRRRFPNLLTQPAPVG